MKHQWGLCQGTINRVVGDTVSSTWVQPEIQKKKNAVGSCWPCFRKALQIKAFAGLVLGKALGPVSNELSKANNSSEIGAGRALW